MKHSDLQMVGLTPAAQAQKAIAHVLDRIHTDPFVGWYLGACTQSFELLTEAYAALTAQPLNEVYEEFVPRAARDPQVEPREADDAAPPRPLPADDAAELIAVCGQLSRRRGLTGYGRDVIFDAPEKLTEPSSDAERDLTRNAVRELAACHGILLP